MRKQGMLKKLAAGNGAVRPLPKDLNDLEPKGPVLPDQLSDLTEGMTDSISRNLGLEGGLKVFQEGKNIEQSRNPVLVLLKHRPEFFAEIAKIHLKYGSEILRHDSGEPIRKNGGIVRVSIFENRILSFMVVQDAAASKVECTLTPKIITHL